MDDFSHMNFADLAANAFQKGRVFAQQRAVQSALSRYSNDPEGAQSALIAAGDVDTANALRQRQIADNQYKSRQQASQQIAAGDIAGAQQTALGGGDIDMYSSIAKLDDNQRQVAADHAQTIAAIGMRLKTMQPDQWGPALQSLKPDLLARGFKPEEVDGAIQKIVSDPSGRALDVLIGSAMSLKDTIAQQDKERDDAETRRYHDLMANRPIVVGDGAMATTRTGQVIANNPKNFAPKSGGKSAAGSHDLPSGFSVIP